MKITKRQLKQIIKEEKAKLIKEQQFDHPLGYAAADIGSAHDGLRDGTMSVEEVIRRLASVKKDLYDFIQKELANR